MNGSPPGPYVRLSVVIPSHPKVEVISDAAYRAFIDSLCYSGANLTDGHISEAAIRRLAKPRVRAELLDVLLWEQNGSAGLDVHGYLEWNRSKQQVEQQKRAQSAGGKKGNLTRWGDGSTDD